MAAVDDGRQRIAANLDEHGATPGDDPALALDMSQDAFWVMINWPWFEITGKGWELTDRGRKEADI